DESVRIVRRRPPGPCRDSRFSLGILETAVRNQGWHEVKLIFIFCIAASRRKHAVDLRKLRRTRVFSIGVARNVDEMMAPGHKPAARVQTGAHVMIACRPVIIVSYIVLAGPHYFDRRAYRF